MSNKPPVPPQDLYDALERYYIGHEPNPDFVARLESGLRSKLIEQESQNMFGRKSRIAPRLAWGLGLALAALLIGLLVASPTVVTAMKRLLGYIPDVGLVEQGAPLRVLAEPVSQTRDGITITVKEAVLSVDKSVAVFTVENIPFDKLSHREDAVACPLSPELRLPDGTRLQINGGSATGWGSGYESRFSFPAIPADINETTLLIPCIQDVLPGVLPENWELPLRFVTAPPEMTVMPVQEVTSESTSGAGEPVEQNPISISNVIETADSYILIGVINPPAPISTDDWVAMTIGMKITDTSGQDVFWDFPQDIDVLPPGPDMPHAESWALKISKSYVPPFHISITKQYVIPANPQETYTFEFDAGPDPQVGQTWALNKEIQMAGYTFILDSISVQLGHQNSKGYELDFTSPDNSVNSVFVSIEGHPFEGGGGGGGYGGNGQAGGFSAKVDYSELPTGRMNIILSDLRVYGETLEWSLDWTPATPPSGFPSPTPAPQACLTLSSLEEALANPQPLPANLTGKLIVYGRILEDGKDPSPDNYGVFIASPDGSSKEILGQGVWSALSPDGTKAAYAWDDGLYVADLASRQIYHVPGTNANDYNPRWSPDGSRIAFVRIDDFNLYIINPDGSGLQKVTEGIEYELLIGWSADGASLYYGIPVQGGHLLRQVDLASGAVRDLFNVISKGVSVAISPDGAWLASVERLADNPQYGLFLSNLNSPERRLLVQVDQWGISDPVWSPDGKWLLFTIIRYDQLNPEEIPTLLDMQTCQAFPLNFRGTVQGWSQ